MPTFIPNKSFTISGTNLNFVRRISFGNEDVTTLSYLGTTGVSGLVPPGAISGDVFVETPTSLVNLGAITQVLDSDSQLSVGPLVGYNVSGKAGDIIQLTGTNFYQVDTVKFGDVSGEFYSISSNLIEAIIPPNADYGGVTVFSSSRTGVDGDISVASGITSNNFVPIPEVTGLNSGQLVSGEVFSLEGRSLSGVTGVSINDIESNSVTLVSSSKINVEVPSGDFRGVPNLLLESGISHPAPNYIQFKPLAKVSGIINNIPTGYSTTISGENFGADILYATGGEYLVSIGGVTGSFGLTSDTTMTGRVPRDLNISVSGGNVAAGEVPVISSGNVSIFSNAYPESYGSDVYFTPLISSPQVSSVTPPSGIGGDMITVEGFDLYAITGVSVNSVGVATSTSAEVVTVGSDGRAITFDFPTDAATISDGAALFDLTLSGVYGNIGVDNAFYTLGKPTITSNEPETDVLPGSSGTIIGTHLYSGTEIQVYDNLPNKFIATLTPSGYAEDHSQLTYWYPNSFATGINYKLRVKNRRHFSSLRAFTTLNTPAISGFEPASGEFGESVTVSGYFEGIVPSGLNVGNVLVSDFSQTASTGITFTIPTPSVSDVIKIETSGGYIQSDNILGVSENKPVLSGFYLGSGVRPDVIYNDQVFKGGDLITISGERMNLVTGVSFSGAVDPIVVSGFNSKESNALALRVPHYINSGSGDFILEDFRGRETSSSTAVSIGGGVATTNVDVVTISGFTNFLVPEATMSLSGNNVTGMSVIFAGPTGDLVTGSPLSNSVDGGVGSITVSVPSSTQMGNLSLTGRHNSVDIPLDPFYPLSVITGISGIDPSLNTISTGANIIITGINSNFINAPQPGEPFVCFSGSGQYGTATQVDVFPISTFATGSGIGGGDYANIFYSEIGVNIGNQFVGTGKFFLLDEWDGYFRSNKNRGRNSWGEFTLGSGTQDIIEDKINFFDNEYSITGTRVLLSGFTPSRGITGSVIDISGEGLQAVSSVGFSQYGGDSHISTDVSGSADGTLIKVTIPSVTSMIRGTVNLNFMGGAGGTLEGFEIIDDTSALEFNVVNPATSTIPTASAGQVVEYTVEEAVGGVVWYITYKQYPDGTKAIVSSFPKPY